MKIKKFGENGTDSVPNLNEKFWTEDKYDVQKMEVIFEDDDELGDVPYLVVTAGGRKYMTKLKVDRDDLDEEE